MELFGLFIVIIIYLCLVYPASLAKKNAKGRKYQPVRRPFEDDDTLYMGSLNAVTGEGTDPCHEDQLADVMPVTESAAEEPSGGLRLGWTGNEVVRGIVMSEVLKRRY